MAERLDLTTPQTKPTTTYYTLARLELDLVRRAVLIELLGEHGERLSQTYDAATTPTGAALLSALNTSNNTSTSLQKRVFQRLVTDGVLAGTVSWSPE